MRDPRDAYERDVANSTSGFGKDSQAYRADGGANDENHALDRQSSTWYIRLNGKLIKDKSGNPYSFQDKAAANKAALTMQAKLFNKDKEFMLTTNPNDKVAEGVPRVDSLVTKGLKLMRGPTRADAIDALKIQVGERDFNERPGFYNFYVRQLMDMYGQQGVAEAGSNDVEEFLHKVARSGDNGFDMLYNAQQGKYGREIEQSIQDMYDDISIDTGYHGDDDFEQIYDRMLDNIEADYGQQGVSEAQQLSVQQLATVSDAALDKAYGYGRSQPGNSFGWQANLKSAAFAKQMIDKGVTDIEAISDAIHKGWNTTAQAFVQNPEQFDDTAKLKAAGKLEAKLQQRAQLMKQNYGQLPEEEKEKDRVVARALLQALKGEQGMAEGWKEKVAAATLAGSMALGAAGAGATGLPGGSPSVDQSAGKAVATQVAPTDAGFINRVLAQHRAMEQMNPQYAKDHAGLNIAMVRGIGGGSDVKNQQWAQKTAQLLQKYGAQVKEDIATQDSGEYDYEGDMAKDDLKTIVRAARRLDGMLDDNENMPEWVQSKINKAADYVDTAADYIESNQEPELEEGERGRGRPPSNTQDTTPVTPGRVEKTATGIRHHADASRYGGTEPDNDEDDHLMSKSHISRLGKMTEPDIDEGEKVGNMDADAFDAAMARLKQLAGAGPMKTVYDPTKRVYRNVPVAVQPKK
jgi:hypothetical protein